MTRWAVAALALIATPALAKQRDYCPERPGLDTPACIVDAGHVSVETAVVDWTLDSRPDSRTDTILLGDTLVRLGVTDTTEVRIGWTPFGHERVRDRMSGDVQRANQTGDVSLGFKTSLSHPDGEELAVALLPYVTLPVGGDRIGAGAVGGGVLLPVTYALSKSVKLDATPEVDAQPNAERPGRHLRYSAAGGATARVVKHVTVSLEAQVTQDDDPDDRTTQAVGALSLTWKPQKDWQLDLFGIAGLNHDAPDLELAAGVSRRF